MVKFMISCTNVFYCHPSKERRERELWWSEQYQVLTAGGNLTQEVEDMM